MGQGPEGGYADALFFRRLLLFFVKFTSIVRSISITRQSFWGVDRLTAVGAANAKPKPVASVDSLAGRRGLAKT